MDDIKCLLIPDNEKTVELLDEIYKVIERMNPNIKDLTAFTELLTELKQVGLNHSTVVRILKNV